MVVSWLLKIVLGIAVAGLAVIELGSPFVARAQADDAAHQVANEAAFLWPNHYNTERLKADCEAEAEKVSVEVLRCEVNAQGVIEVLVRKQAFSLLLDRFSATEDWYQIEVGATATPK